MLLLHTAGASLRKISTVVFIRPLSTRPPLSAPPRWPLAPRGILVFLKERESLAERGATLATVPCYRWWAENVKRVEWTLAIKLFILFKIAKIVFVVYIVFVANTSH